MNRLLHHANASSASLAAAPHPTRPGLRKQHDFARRKLALELGGYLDTAPIRNVASAITRSGGTSSAVATASIRRRPQSRHSRCG